jgi:A/G-specific adenine glycosylase
LGVEVAVGEELGIYNHAYTHFKVTLHAFFCTLALGEPQPLSASEIRWVLPQELSAFPMGKIDRLISKDLLRHLQPK